jgi:actin-like ATPase involved in cell morphogenesis
VATSIDIGTGFLVSARQDSNNQIAFKTVRDSFLDLENDVTVKNMLSMSKIDYIESDDKLYIIGENATSMANIFKREARRPLSQGVLAPGELEAERIILVLIEHILGRARVPEEVCFYSVPAAPLDRNIDVIYHQAIFSKLIGSLGYKPVALNEGAAIGYSNSAKEQFSSVNLSFGAGMVNVCLMYKTMIGMAFSISKSGDYLDQSAAAATGSTAGRIQAIKERGVNLMDPKEGDPKNLREREALVIYYKSLIVNVLNAIKSEFLKHKGNMDLPTALPIILSGGTSLAKNFKELFEEGFNSIKKDFPLSISEIRMASDPLNAVAQGLLVAAMNYGQ